MKVITGKWEDAAGQLAAYGRVHFRLNQDAATLTGDTRVVPREVFFQLTNAGALPEDSQIWANDELSPAGTYYRMSVNALGGGTIAGPEHLILSGPSPININSLVPGTGIPAPPFPLSIRVGGL
jgi:hypothetical protein